jgi:hypothetical protein
MLLLARFRALPAQSRIAVVTTAMLTLAGLCFALFAPHLPIERRAARGLIDAIVLAGIVAYIFDPPPSAKASRPPTLRWFVSVVFTLAAIGFIAFAPGVDSWLRAYRLTLGGIVLAAIVFRVQRPMPTGWFRRVLAVQCAVIAVEFVTALYVTMSVDIPITMAGAGAVSRSVAARLETTGIPEPPVLRDDRVKRLMPRNDFVFRHGRVFATPLLSDELHAVRNDPFAAAMAVIAAVPGFRIARVSSDRLMCASFNAIDPPPHGYHTMEMQEEVRGLRAYCGNRREVQRHA